LKKSVNQSRVVHVLAPEWTQSFHYDLDVLLVQRSQVEGCQHVGFKLINILTTHKQLAFAKCPDKSNELLLCQWLKKLVQILASAQEVFVSILRQELLAKRKSHHGIN
jgi:hypothetical protein